MRIAIDARWIFQEISGIGAYTRALIKHLSVLDTVNDYTIIFNKQSVLDRTVAETGLDRNPKFKTELLNFGIFSIKGQFVLPGFLKKNEIDVYHSTNFMIPLIAFPSGRPGRTKCVITIHDVIPMIFPDHAPKSKKSRMLPFYKILMAEIGRRADMIIADSEASRRDVIKHLRIPIASENKINVIYCGVGDQFKVPENQSSRVEGQVLYVGRLDTYKNVSTLIKAIAEAKKKSDLPIILIIAGSPDQSNPDLHMTAEELGISDSVRWTGYLTDDELLKLYQQSTLLAHPSRYEGFGLQIAEAMACGTPVVCANAGSQTEVAGDAAVLLDPDDVNGFSESIVSIVSDKNIAENMSRKGLEQAAKFTWRKTAEQTLKIYEKANSIR